MNGAEYLVKTAVQAGVDTCFANPGTTEIPLVTALGAEPGIKSILGLFEGVCTGAADGYARMADKPAMTLVHLGPGLANAAASLHNARKARTPVLNVVGEHASWHRATDPPLGMDIETLARPLSGWIHTVESAEALSRDTADAIAAACRGQVSTLIVPHDFQMTDGLGPDLTPARFTFDPVDANTVEKAAELLRSRKATALLLGGRALRRRGLEAAARIKAVTGCDLITDILPGYMDRGAGLPVVERVPFSPEAAVKMLSKYEAVVLAGTKEPVAFFGYAGQNSYLLAREAQKVSLATERQDAAEALEGLAMELKSRFGTKIPQDVLSQPLCPGVPHGELTPPNICQALAALQPEDAIIIDEGLTTSTFFCPMTSGLPPHSYLTVAGGAIGFGIPGALGAAVASPGRPVISIEGDGSAMYTVQGLWTQAREQVNVTTLICSNRGYEILKRQLPGYAAGKAEPRAESLLDMNGPKMDWVGLSRSMGVPAVSVTTVEELSKEYRNALSEPGPHLIEMMVA